MYCILGESDKMRTENIVKNISVASSVRTDEKNHYIEFYTEYWNNKLKKIVPSKIIYVINSNLVHGLKHARNI